MQKILSFVNVKLKGPIRKKLFKLLIEKFNMTINQKAPIVQSNTIFIHADISTVWNVLHKIDQWPYWNHQIKNIDIKKAPAKGVTFTWQSNGSKIKSKIHTYNIDKAIGWSGRAFGAKAIHNWSLQSFKSGTKVFTEESMEGWLVSLMKNKIARILKKDMSHWLEQLRIECEAQMISFNERHPFS